MKYLIMGFGKFGRLAFDRLKERFPDRPLLVVEREEDLASLGTPPLVLTHKGDAVSFLLEAPGVEDRDIVIPMVPFHLAAAYLCARLSDMEPITLPKELADQVPNPFPLDDSNLCCSLAHFLCPDDCPEGDYCTVTGERRDKPLYGILEELDAPGFQVVVQRSYQILPGVGGYRMDELRNLPGMVTSRRCIVATSCKCHGILTGIGNPIEPPNAKTP